MAVQLEQTYAFLKCYMNISREEFEDLQYWQIRLYTKAIEDKLKLESEIRYKELVVLNHNKYRKGASKKLWD